MEKYVVYKGKKLRYGYTTGSCATAAATAAILVLFEKEEEVEKVEINLPSGDNLILNIKEIIIDKNSVTALVIKDSGDDPDVTNGIEIRARVSKRADKKINIFGGKGVGKVTKKGLPVEVGKSAINPTPLKMIYDGIEKLIKNEKFGVDIEIIVPKGEKIAKKTLNSKLGIEGGISILGSTGIVKPMSEEALKDSLAAELRVIVAENNSKKIIYTFGNYGKNFALKKLSRNSKNIMTISNFIGFMLDRACELDIEKIEIIGNIGKFVKVAGGIFHTHSRIADGRLEILTANALLCNESKENLIKIMNSNTTEEALDYIEKKEVYSLLCQKAKEKCEAYVRRNGKEIEVSILIFSNEKGELGRSKNFD